MNSARRKPTREEILDGLHNVIRRAGELNQATLRRYRSAPSVEQVMREFSCLYDAYELNLAVRSPWLIGGHLPYWVARWPDSFPVDFLVYGRIERAGTDLLDFHIFPRGSLVPGAFTVVCRHGQTHFGTYQRPDLRSLLVIAERVPLPITPVDYTTGSGQ